MGIQKGGGAMNLRYAMGAVLLTFTVGSMTAFADMTSRRVRLETDGGAIEVEAKRPNDIQTRNAVREQLKQQMRKGMPLTNSAILQHQKEIKYKYEKTDRGGRIRIVAKSREALSAVQGFLRSQMTVPEDTKTLTFTFIEGTSLVVLPVTINDRGTFQFLLDTGASHTMLSAKVADSLGIPKGRPE